MSSPFDWRGKPSIVVNDLNFKAHKGGKSKEQIARESVQKVYDRGINHAQPLDADEAQPGIHHCIRVAGAPHAAGPHGMEDGGAHVARHHVAPLRHHGRHRPRLTPARRVDTGHSCPVVARRTGA